MKLKQHRKSLSWHRRSRKKAKHELETVQKEKRKITNELEEKIVKKAKVNEKYLLSSISEVSNLKYIK